MNTGKKSCQKKKESKSPNDWLSAGDRHLTRELQASEGDLRKDQAHTNYSPYSSSSTLLREGHWKYLNPWTFRVRHRERGGPQHCSEIFHLYKMLQRAGQ